MDINNPSYAEMFGHPPIYDLLFACLTPRSLIRLALTCRAAYMAVVEFKIRAFNINHHFSRYFRDPLMFRSLQARTNMLVSGSNALRFLGRSFYPEADLDLYTHPGHSSEVAKFLVEVEGYVYVPGDFQPGDWKKATEWQDKFLIKRRVVPRGRSSHGYPTMNITVVWTFEKMGTSQDCLKVQVIQGESSPLETIL